MMKSITTLVLLCQIALFFAIPAIAQEKESYATTQAFEFSTDKGLLLNVELLLDKSKNPIYYSAHIATEVCSDSLCKPIDLTVYWDLMGRFSDYHTREDRPLTKFDHIEFTRADGKKLRDILKDERSMLKDYEAEDMIDRSVKVHSNKMDAVTGATSKSFQDVIVPGAVYTVHTLWHIVNGGVADKILGHTKSILNETLIRWMLRSGNPSYQHFILKELPNDKLKPFSKDMISLIGSKDEFTPHLAIDKIPKELWLDTAVQQEILNYLSNVHLELQNSILLKFKDLKLGSAELMILLRHVDKLNANQIEKVVNIFLNNTEFIDENLKKELSALLINPKPEVAQGAKEILKSIKK
ncbi:MAG: hypothetical protein WC623_10550 [Pedobacter sp.]|uniref:hypothetical protein n=1 Tax=Pedobacter sp. TaxID=1411316 RepID=UPI00356A423D